MIRRLKMQEMIEEFAEATRIVPTCEEFKLIVEWAKRHGAAFEEPEEMTIAV